MKVVTAAEMRDIDRVTIGEYGISGPVLMERAGLSVAEQSMKLPSQKDIVVLCGTGNNGGDGLVAARILHNRGSRVTALILAEGRELSPDCEAQHRTAVRMGVPVLQGDRIGEREIMDAGLIIDAVFGTGLTRPVSERLAAVFEQVNRSPAPVLAVDMPSGISSDTGAVMGAAIRADRTVTFGLPKRGQLLHPGAAYTGHLVVAEIGFPPSLLTSKGLSVSLTSPRLLSESISRRRRQAHKGDFGHIFLVAGSRGKTGAALMAAKACLRSGAGLVTLGVPRSLTEVFEGKVLEEMILPLPDDDKGMISGEALKEILSFSESKADILAIGPGIGVSEGIREVIGGIIMRSEHPLVIDADGLNALDDPSVLSQAGSDLILTPHPGEMARLLRKTGDRIQNTEHRTQSTAKLITHIEQDRIGTAQAFSLRTGAHLVLKGGPTIVAAPSGETFINSSGNPGMATAGSGDVLTGVIAGLLGQGLSPLLASATGVWLHGHAGDLAARVKGEHSLIASDIIASLPEAFSSLLTTE